MREGPSTNLPEDEPQSTSSNEPTEAMEVPRSSPPRERASASDEPRNSSGSAPSSGGPDRSASTAPPAEPAGEAEESGEGSPLAEEPPGAPPVEEEEVLPPDIAVVSLPLVGNVPLWLLGAVAGLGTLVFVALLALGLRSWRAAPAETPPTADRPATPPARVDPLPPDSVAQMAYQSLIDAARGRMEQADYAAAAQLAREAASREEKGIARVLLARHLLSRALAELGHYEEALHESESLRSLSRPGDELWRHALVTSIVCLGRQEQWQEFYRNLHLLRANSARYGDEIALNRWLAYNRAMAAVRLHLQMSGEAGRLYGVSLPPLGRAPSRCRPLAEHDIVVVSGRYGDGSVEVRYSTGELDLRAEGAPLREVLQALALRTGLELEQVPPGEHLVTARLEAVVPEHALEMVLGSVGFQAETADGVAVISELEPLPPSAERARRNALWSTQEFLILYPESPNVAEAYYALGHLYMLDGHTRMALDQLEILCNQYPRSPWAAYAHYLAGRTYYNLQDWGAAERELLLLAEGAPNHPLTPSAYLWAAQSQVRLSKYDDAVRSFRRALAHEANEPLEAEILYNIAYCMEMGTTSPHEVEERYLELRSRFPDSPFARRADYRLARMALEDGRYRRAVARYEFFLANWPIDEEETPTACRDLIAAYLGAGEHIRAVLLGEVMVATFGHQTQYWQALPDLLGACREFGLHEMAVAMLDRALTAAREPERRARLMVQKAGFLMDMGEFDEAGAVLARADGMTMTPEVREQAALAAARLKLRREAPAGLAACRRLAAEARSEQVRSEALRLMGRYYREVGRFDRAALFYSGKSPLDEEAGL